MPDTLQYQPRSELAVELLNRARAAGRLTEMGYTNIVSMKAPIGHSAGATDLLLATKLLPRPANSRNCASCRCCASRASCGSRIVTTIGESRSKDRTLLLESKQNT